MVTIRKSTIEDVDSVLLLIRKLYGEIGHKFPFSDSNAAKIFCHNLLEDENYIVFIATDSKNPPCGIITLNEGVSVYTGGKFGIIREFYVIEENRSSGIGKALLYNAMKFARSKGWKRLEVTPPHKEKWQRTYNFYIREGFVEIGPRLKFENLHK